MTNRKPVSDAGELRVEDGLRFIGKLHLHPIYTAIHRYIFIPLLQVQDILHKIQRSKTKALLGL